MAYDEAKNLDIVYKIESPQPICNKSINWLKDKSPDRIECSEGNKVITINSVKIDGDTENANSVKKTAYELFKRLAFTINPKI